MSHLTLFWFKRKNGKPNFGDDLSQPICQFVAGSEVRHASRKTADLYGIGSLLQYFSSVGRARKIDLIRFLLRKAPLVIWGTGLLRDMQTVLPLSEVLALRGKYTAENLNLKRDVPFGDPGLIVSDIVRGGEKTGKIGVVPHFSDKSCYLFNSIRGDDRFTFIDVEGHWEVTVRRISECSAILSSSLHGIIVADAFHIPSHRIILPDSAAADSFKFNDYVSAFGDTEMSFTRIDTPQGLQNAAKQVYDDGPRLSTGELKLIKDDLKAALVKKRLLA